MRNVREERLLALRIADAMEREARTHPDIGRHANIDRIAVEILARAAIAAYRKETAFVAG